MSKRIIEKVGKTTEISVFENALQGDKKLIPITINIGNYLWISASMINGSKGWFVSYPSYKAKDGDYKNQVFAKKEFTDSIVKAFEKIYNGNAKTNTLDNVDITDAEDLPF